MKRLIIDNKEVLLDDEDFELVKGKKLRIVLCRGVEVVQFHDGLAPHYLHRYVLNYPKQKILFKDNNKLNCQKNNLYLTPTGNVIEYRKKYYAQNRDKIIKRASTWAKNNPNKMNEKSRKYRKTAQGKKTQSQYRKCSKAKEYYSGYYKSKSRETKYRYNYAKNKCKRRNIEFSLTLEEYDYLINQPCYYSGESLEHEMGTGLDRIDNSKGYVIDNVLPCIGWCNRVRGFVLTVEEAKIAIAAVLNFRKRDGLVKKE